MSVLSWARRSIRYRATGLRGDWEVRWDGTRREYVVTLDGRRRGTATTASDGKRDAEFLERHHVRCTACQGSGWVPRRRRTGAHV